MTTPDSAACPTCGCRCHSGDPCYGCPPSSAATVADAVADFNLDHKVAYDETMGSLCCPSCGVTDITTREQAIHHALRKDGTRGCRPRTFMPPIGTELD